MQPHCCGFQGVSGTCSLDYLTSKTCKQLWNGTVDADSQLSACWHTCTVLRQWTMAFTLTPFLCFPSNTPPYTPCQVCTPTTPYETHMHNSSQVIFSHPTALQPTLLCQCLHSALYACVPAHFLRQFILQFIFRQPPHKKATQSSTRHTVSKDNSV